MSDHLQPEPPPVDLALLGEVFENDSEQIREVLVLYLEQTGDQLKKMRTALTAGADDEVRHLAHKSAGSSASCGMTQIVPLLRDLERMGKEKNLTGAEPVYGAVLKEFSSIENFLKKHLGL